MQCGAIRAATYAYQDDIPFVVRLPNGQLIHEGSLALEPGIGFVLSLVPPQEGNCPFDGTPAEDHLPPLPGTNIRRCPKCCHFMFRIVSVSHGNKLYWSNDRENWVQNKMEGTLFSSRNDPSAPKVLREGTEWEVAFEAPRQITQ